MNPTTNQRKVIDAECRNTLVSAGAGCGKSTVLTKRIIKRIKEGKLSVKNIVVLSFTNASANDIRKKIKEALKDELINNPSLQSEYDYIDQSNISTFDSLCHNLFLRYAYKLNIKSDINLADSNQAIFVLSDILVNISKKYKTDNRFISLLDKYSYKDEMSVLSGILSFYLKKVNNVIDPKTFLNEAVEKTINARSIVIDKVVSDRTSAIKNIIEEWDKSMDDECREALEPFVAPFVGVDYDIAINNMPINEKFPAGNRKPFAGAKKAVEREIASSIKESLGVLANTPTLLNLNGLYDGYIDDSSVVRDILFDLIDEYEKYTLDTNIFTFSDIAKLVIKIFKENSDVLAEIKSEISEIYIDEYQDTSNIQEELISLISNDNVMVVGDIKQSIYRFRDANPDIFKAKFDDYGPKGRRIDMQDNFRSRPDVINAINDMFDLIMIPEYGGIDYKKSHRLAPGKKSEDHSTPIEYHYVKSKDENDKKIKKHDINMKTIDDVFNDILAKMDKNKSLKFSDFAIITRNKNYYNQYQKAAQSRNIPLASESSKPFIRNTEIMTLLSFLSYLNNKDKLSFLSILRSFLFDLSDDEIYDASKGIYSESVEEIKSMLDYINMRRNYITIYDLANEIILGFGFYENLYKLSDPVGAERRLLYILTTFQNFMNMGWGYQEAYRYFERLALPSISELDISYQGEESTEENAITLLTIHKSKGLEYPYIYFIETDSVIGKESNDFIGYSETYGMGFKELYNSPYVTDLIFEENVLIQKLEDFRLLYVCLTRAKEGIIIFTRGDNNSYELDTKLKECVTPDELKSYKTYDDIIKGVHEVIHVEDIKEMPNPTDIVVKNEDIPSFKEINPFVTIVDGDRLSHISTSLITEEDKNAMNYGTHLHEAFEDFDFNCLDTSMLDPITKAKVDAFIDTVINNKSIIRDKILGYYKEYQIPYKDTFGSIDILIETESSFVVIDYKSKDIDKPYYIDQVKGYMTEIKSRTDKVVYGYLYSLSLSTIKEVK